MTLSFEEREKEIDSEWREEKLRLKLLEEIRKEREKIINEEYAELYNRTHKEEIEVKLAREEHHKKRELLIIQFGGKCEVCGSIESLSFHHKVYDTQNICSDILKEVSAYPERFSLLCYRCHYFVTFFKRFPDLDIDKVKKIIEIASIIIKI